MKVAFSSDNHFDLNKINVERAMRAQALYLLNKNVNVYVIAGDLFNDFKQSLAFARNMQDLVKNKLTIRFLAGNHDMGKNVTYEELESDIDELYFHNKYIDLTDDIRLIGNNGWYDYSFVGNDYTEEEIQSFKNSFWYDRRIKQPITDKERFNINLKQIKDQLLAAGNKQTIVVSHFVPREDYIKRFPNGNTRLDIANAFLGSSKIGQIVDQSYTIATITGHLHLHPAPLKFGNNVYYNAAVGYSTERVHEWSSDDFLTEWQKRLVVLEF
ncbi:MULTISPECIES: metallophosphoesterase [Leuconostoc]|uniref:metallophosphoesterase n=1 Tax=Leuconostoc TaxID=1243 RepID=UPI00090BDB93|nr:MULTISPECIES: metallophosphoesterase [Leuconostoc]API71398.1 phosphohydrolase [Leuconostoc suionicum]MBE4727898.1 metallophosphoesterase [Leuconostoc suionicum]MBS1007373.1 metallophosphoesterase [Leuconostoc suionicum]MCT4377244.1 phosphohydrolase [Leuconostoc suionicum]MDC2805956.1 metallophosphoesterase [Leuconostoc suionicum]